MLPLDCDFPPLNYQYVSVRAIETAQHLISLYDLHHCPASRLTWLA